MIGFLSFWGCLRSYIDDGNTALSSHSVEPLHTSCIKLRWMIRYDVGKWVFMVFYGSLYVGTDHHALVTIEDILHNGRTHTVSN